VPDVAMHPHFSAFPMPRDCRYDRPQRTFEVLNVALPAILFMACVLELLSCRSLYLLLARRFCAELIPADAPSDMDSTPCGCAHVTLLSSSSFTTVSSPASPAFAPPHDVTLTPPPAPSSSPTWLTIIQQHLDRHGDVQRRLEEFVRECAVKREAIVTKFGRLQETLSSCERAVLVAYDDEVKAVVKQLEVEAESVEVLSEQLLGKIECGLLSGMGEEELVGASVDAWESGVRVRSVDVSVWEEGLSSLMGVCWELVRSESDRSDTDEQALANSKLELGFWKRVCVVMVEVDQVCDSLTECCWCRFCR
jgi:hypothetical protein